MADGSYAMIAQRIHILGMERVQIGLRLWREDDRQVGLATFSFTEAPARPAMVRSPPSMSCAKFGATPRNSGQMPTCQRAMASRSTVGAAKELTKSCAMALGVTPEWSLGAVTMTVSRAGSSFAAGCAQAMGARANPITGNRKAERLKPPSGTMS